MNELALETIRRHEGLRLYPYKDTVGKTTIGYGRNLDDRGITLYEAELLLKHDIQEAQDIVSSLVDNFYQLSDTRQAVLINMAFNLGKPRLSGFSRMLEALGLHDYETAADEMLDSKWSRQVGRRAVELANMMRVG